MRVLRFATTILSAAGVGTMALALNSKPAKDLMPNERVEIMVGEPRPVEMNFEDRRWSADGEFAEGDFPLIATVRGKRYELYSDGTFDEEER